MPTCRFLFVRNEKIPAVGNVARHISGGPMANNFVWKIQKIKEVDQRVVVEKKKY